MAERRAYAGRTAQERDEARRRRLLDAALELFGTAGYRATPIEAVLRKAGVSSRHFYAVFPGGREELFVAVYDEAVAFVLGRVEHAAAQDTPDGGRRVYEALAAAYEDDPRIGRVVLVEVLGISPAVEAHRRAAIDRFTAQAARLAGVPELRALALVGATVELLARRLAPDPPSRAAVVDECVAVHAALLGPLA
jgi:AcrR family transcriptional regulator